MVPWDAPAVTGLPPTDSDDELEEVQRALDDADADGHVSHTKRHHNRWLGSDANMYDSDYSSDESVVEHEHSPPPYVDSNKLAHNNNNNTRHMDMHV